MCTIIYTSIQRSLATPQDRLFIGFRTLTFANWVEKLDFISFIPSWIYWN